MKHLSQDIPFRAQIFTGNSRIRNRSVNHSTMTFKKKNSGKEGEKESKNEAKKKGSHMK
jgi:hypothetical protein